MVTQCNNVLTGLPISEVVIPSATPPTQQDASNTINTIPMSLPVNEQLDSTELTSASLIELYHDNVKNYVIEQYCESVSHSFKNPNVVCHYNRNCIVLKSKILSKGKQQKDLSKTIFGSITWPSGGNYEYRLVDTRVIRCLNPTCKSPINKQPKIFHYCCYMHMMARKKEEMPVHLKISNNKDRLIDFVDGSVDMASICEKTINTNSTQLIFPVCGKRCYSKLCNHQCKVKNTTESEYATSASWETDGDKTKLSSVQVLINWLTTEENCSTYFGGIDVNGRTSANRKETYHHQIRDMIKKENGKYPFLCFTMNYFIE